MEQEMKFKVESFSGIIPKIEQLGFTKVKEKRVIDHYYIVNKTNEYGFGDYLRLREGSPASMDFHSVLNKTSTEEIELPVESISEGTKFIEKLGFTKKCTVDKNRVTYARGEIKIVLDTVLNLGNFIEVEIVSDISKENTLLDLTASLGLENPIIRKGYPDLLLQENEQG